MNPEIRACKKCAKDFRIEPEDFAFYDKIRVPPPTLCPECRLIRRLVLMNERVLYKRVCSKCRKSVISNMSEVAPFPVYCNGCWWSDSWDPIEYGQEFDFTRSFFEQFKELYHKVPWQNLHVLAPTLINSEYSHNCSYLKDCYLLFTSDYSENCMYGNSVEYTKDSLDLLFAHSCTECYESVNIQKCNRTFYSVDCADCFDVYASKNLAGCSDCVGCINLKNKKYHIFNEPYTRQEYEKKVEEMKLDTREGVEALRKKANEFFLTQPRRYMQGRQNADVSGEYIVNSKNTHESYQIMDTIDSKFCSFFILGPVSDAYDFSMWGGGSQLVYECIAAGGGISNALGCFEVWSESPNMSYCSNIIASCANLFGCIGLRNKKYCILNKQYTKEEYEALVPKIIEHMKRLGEYGEFFPESMSPFAYNETSAHECFPLTKEEAVAKGYRWKDPEKKSYATTLDAEVLPQTIAEVLDSILTETIACLHAGECVHGCTQAYRILPQELGFYRKYSLPLPQLCPNCRYGERLKERNSMKLWDRVCAKCAKPIRTSYAPERPEIVYCERCYQAEVV